MKKSYLKFLVDISTSRLVYKARNVKRRQSFPVGSRSARDHLAQLRDVGYSVVPTYLTGEQCATMRDGIDQALANYPDATWTGAVGADKRIFGIENASPDFKPFFEDPDLLSVASQYCGNRVENLLTLAGKIDAVSDNIGSGGGWHRDGNHFQFKAIVYLSDTEMDNGPFQLIEGSHRYPQIVADNYNMQVDDTLATRFSNEQVDVLIARDPKRLVSFPAPAGTLLLIDTSTIHRGAPIEKGNRYALTNYYYPHYDMAGRLEKFTPRLTSQMVSSLSSAA